MTSVIDATDAPVRKTITVKATAEHAFQVFTEGFDTWWPRSHSISESPMEKAPAPLRAGLAAQRRMAARSRPREGERGRDSIYA